MGFVNNQHEYKNLTNYNDLNQLIKEWVDKFIADKESIHVAISRKAPRLLEWGLHGEFGNDVNVVTELALPFVDWKKETKCLVVDEAIYHGTTFEKILSLLQQVNSDWEQLCAMPLVVTTEALRSFEIESHLASVKKIIDNNEIPFFVDTIISKFFELGKPYDIEYPLFYIDFKHEITDGDMMDVLKKLAQLEASTRQLNSSEIDFYKVKNYSRERNREFVTYTYNTDYLYDHVGYGMAKPDFSKLRFFVKGSRLCIASMSPYIIPEQYISRESLLFGANLMPLWNEIYQVAKSSSLKAKALFNSDKEYSYQWNKSMVMAANYLLSFNQFLRIRKSLLLALGEQVEEKVFYHDKKDLCYLFGKELTEKLMPQLETLSEDETNGRFLSLGRTVKSVIPTDYSRSYNFQIGVDNLRNGQTENVSLMLSSMFSSMHWLIEVQSRMSAHRDYGRLRFGESYASITERLQSTTHFSQEDLSRAIHRGIDQRIDRGSVVPNYVRVEEGVFASWMRLFRSGENEDVLKDQLLRIILRLVRSYFDYIGKSFITRNALEYIFSVFYFLENKNAEIENTIHGCLNQKLFTLAMVPTFNLKTLMYEIKVQMGNQMIGLVDYAIDNSILKVDEFGYLITANSSYFERLSSGAPIDDEMQVVVNKVIASSSKYGELDDYEILEELNKWYEYDANLPLSQLHDEVYRKMMALLQSDVIDSSCLDDALGAATKFVARNSFLGELKYNESLTYYGVIQILKTVTDVHAELGEKMSKALYKVFVDYSKQKGKRFPNGKGCYNWLCQMKSLTNIMSIPQQELKEKLMYVVK